MPETPISEVSEAVTVDTLSSLAHTTAVLSDVLLYSYHTGESEPHRKVSVANLRTMLGIYASNFSIGDGATTIFDLTHGFNSRYIDVLVIKNSNGEELRPPAMTILRTSPSYVRLVFTAAPALNEYSAHLSTVKAI